MGSGQRYGDPAQDPPGTCRWRNPSDSGPWIKVADDRWVHVGGGGGQDDEVVAEWPVGTLRPPPAPSVGASLRGLHETLGVEFRPGITFSAALALLREAVGELDAQLVAQRRVAEERGAALARVRERHVESEDGPYCTTCGPGYHTICCGDPAWPCPTSEALDGVSADPAPIDWSARLRAAADAVADASFLSSKLRVVAELLPLYHPRVVEAVERELGGRP